MVGVLWVSLKHQGFFRFLLVLGRPKWYSQQKTHPTLNHVSRHPAIRPSPPACASTWRNPRKAAATSLLFRRRVAHFGGWSVAFLLRHPFFVWFLKDYQKENQSHSWESPDKTDTHTHTHISKELRTGEDAPGLRLHSRAWRT